MDVKNLSPDIQGIFMEWLVAQEIWHFSQKPACGRPGETALKPQRRRDRRENTTFYFKNM
jgi:hypothetical protein